MDGVRFTCQPNCTACCEVRGFVYLTEQDLRNAAKFLKMSAADFEARYVYRTAGLLRLRKPPGSQCHFLNATGCSVHPAKPTQCRTFPFWPELVERPSEWKETAKYCPGIGQGPLIQIGTTLEMAHEMRSAYPFMYPPAKAR